MTVDLTVNTDSTGLLLSRQARFTARYDMYHDNYRPQILKRLTDIYAKASILNMDKQIDFTNNVFKTIVNKISRVYTFGFTREFSDERMDQL